MKAKAKTTTKAAEIVLLQVSAAYRAKVIGAAKADSVKAQAITKAEQTIVTLGDDTAKEFKDKEREAVRQSILPVFVKAYSENGSTEEYAKQQLSRVLSIAFPGGAKGDADSQKRGKEQLAKGRALKLGTNDLVRLANGKAILDKENKIVTVVSGGSGGSNAKTPKETFEAGVEKLLIDYCKTAKKSFPVALNSFIDIGVTLKLNGAQEASDKLG